MFAWASRPETPGASPPGLASLVGIVKSALTHLALTVPEAWKSYPSEAFPVLRILVGDCNLEKDEAANATQDVDPAPISHLQRTCGLEPGGASQPAEDDEMPDCVDEPEHRQPSPQTSEAEAASVLHEEMRSVYEDENTAEDIRQKLGHILFMRRTVTTEGVTRKYVASSSETRACIENLLRRRKDFMEANGGAPQPATHGGAPQLATVGASQEHYVFSSDERQAVMQQWKDEYHGTHEQIQLQLRDSWKPMPEKKVKGKGKGKEKGKGEGKEKGKGKGKEKGKEKGMGPNSQAVQKGKHSRFSRHLQRVAGSKTMAELIVYTGRLDLDFLRSSAEPSDLSEPAADLASRPDNAALEKAAAEAKMQYSMTTMLKRRLDDGKVQKQELSEREHSLLADLMDGTLRERTNTAILAYGHGNLRRADGQTLAIGGSTGGLTRRLLDGKKETDVEAFLSLV